MDQTTTSRLRLSGDLASVIVVVASLMMLWTGRALEGRPLLMGVAVLASLAYLLVGIFLFPRVEAQRSPALTTGYFVIRMALGGGVTVLAQSSTWLLLLPAISEAIQILPRGWALFCAAAAYLLEVLPFMLARRWDLLFSLGFAYLAAIVFVAVFTEIAMSEQRARVALSEANRKLREYSDKVEELAIAQERNRLAREIHDGLGHYLTAVNIQIKAARAMFAQNPEMARTALDNAQNLAEEALADVRRSVSALRADPATSRPLPDTLETLLAETRAAGCQADLTIHGTPRPLPSKIEFTLYRAAQEGLTNVRKHAQAAHAELVLAYQEGSVGLTVEDDGVGSPPDATGSGFGLTGLRERVELLNGRLTLDTAPGHGFKLRVDIPIAR